MLSFFRRKKPEAAPTDASKRLSVEELAAAFPHADTPTPNDAPADNSTPTTGAEPPVEATSAVVGPGLDPGLTTAPAEPVPAEVIAAALETDSAPGHPTPDTVSGDQPGPVATPDTTAVDASDGKKGWRDRLRGTAFARAFGGLFSRNPKLDDDLLDEVETALLTADVGVAATTQLVESLRKRMKAREFADAQALLKALRADLIALIAPVAKPLVIDASRKPFVVLTVGVNGVGKTTTIGKLAKRYKDEGHALMLAHLKAEPLLDLGLRLGEGSGAALAWPLLMSACAILREMASFESAGVSRQDEVATTTSPQT